MDPREEGRYDDLFLTVLQQCQKLEPFLDHFFNFLYRRTDLYRIMRHKHDTMGFNPGVADEMVKKVMVDEKSKFENLCVGVACHDDVKIVHACSSV